MDTLEPWQLTIAIRLQNAVRYLRLLELDEQRARIYNTIYRCEDVKEWARNHARDQIRQINESAARHNPRHTDVQSVEAGWNDALERLGLNITVRAVGGIRTEVKAETKVKAEEGNDGRETTTESSHDRTPPLARRGTARDHAAASATRLPLRDLGRGAGDGIEAH